MSVENNLQLFKKIKTVKHGDVVYTYEADKYDTKNYNKTYYESNREKVKALKAAMYQLRKHETRHCDICGVDFHYSNINRHNKGKNHIIFSKIKDDIKKSQNNSI